MKKPDLFKKDIEKFEPVCFGSKARISGIYAIVFYRKDVERVKIYIGSSVDIVGRTRDHARELRKKNHMSQQVTKLYHNKNYKTKFIVLERCEESMVMQKEREYQHKWSDRCVLNSWRAVDGDCIKDWLEKAIKSKTYSDYKMSETNFYNGTACKESCSTSSEGYSKMNVYINGKMKCLRKHRVAYWEKYGEYPELVRHMCNNSACYNPDHLMKGNHRENNLDKRGDFPEKFERDWVRLEGDLGKLTDLYGWKGNCKRKGRRVSTAAYGWEKSLDLRNKYPEIYYKKASRGSLWKRKDIRDFLEECVLLYGKNNRKIAEAINSKYGFELTARSVAGMKIKIRGRTRNRKRVAGCDSTGATTVIRNYYEHNTDERLVEICNQKLGTSYGLGEIRGLRFDMSLYKPKMIQEMVGDLYNRDAVSRWGIEAEKLVELYGDSYSDDELVEICAREYGEDKGFDVGVIQEIRFLLSQEMVGQTG